MRHVKVSAAAAIAVGILGFAAPVQAQVTAYEGARIIVGNGTTIENGTIVVDGARIVQAGSASDVKVPANAKRVSLTGKTVMPMIIDTHVHLSGKRETLVRDLKQRAYWGVSTAMSMGTDNLELLPMRDEVIPGAARFMSAGRGITRPEPLRPTHPDQQRGRRPQRRSGRTRSSRSTSSRSGSTTGTARSRRSRPNNMPPSSTRRTSSRSASRRISSTWRTPRD